MTDSRDEHWMNRALEEARTAAASGEVPVGAVIVDPATDTLVASAWNRPIGENDPTAHAEILAMRAAGAALGNYRLTGLDLYVTLEPCAMCAGAISHARLRRLVYGADDPKGGGVSHGGRFFEQPTCHWKPEVVGGVRATECGDLLRAFFRAKRSG
ncbi:MAG: tRNA adenosine(34) deaminase TadA [Hyphomonadaceae bacterium]